MGKSEESARKLLKILLEENGVQFEGKFEDVLLSQLGDLGQIALNLEAIASVNPGKSRELAQSLDKAQADNETEKFNRLVRQIEILAETARNL